MKYVTKKYRFCANMDLTPMKFRIIFPYMSVEYRFEKYPLSSERRFSLVPRVAALGWTTVGGWRHIRRVYSGLEFCFRLSSEDETAFDLIDGAERSSTFPHLLVKLPGMVHENRVKGGRTAFFLQYPGEEINRFRAGKLDLSDPLRHFVLTPELLEQIDVLKGYCRHLEEPGVVEEIDILALRLIQGVYMSRPEIADDDAELRIHRIASHQLANLAAPEDFNVLAERYGFSRRSFYRHWKKLYPVSPAEFLAARRMDLACAFLVECHWKIRQITEHLHYPGVAYFIQMFKRRFGVTPAVYRRRYGDVSSPES